MALERGMIAGAIAGSLLLGGCVGKADDDADDGASSGSSSEGAGESSSGGDAGSSGGSDASEGSEGSSESGGPSGCAGGSATLAMMVEFPGKTEEHEQQPEGGGIERDATCVADGGGMGGNAWQLLLTCEDANGPEQPYVITLEMSEPPFDWASSDPIELQYREWWGFEVGSGARIALAQGGVTQLVAYAESADGGVVGHCANETDSMRARANDWLDAVNARVEPAGCDDPSDFRLARSADDGEAYAFPGQITAFDDGYTALIEAARCAIEPNSGAESWSLRLAIWH